ncbi:hypothetical protein C0992_004271 [Termitomyces sp. T32_za158]|nr:hypothetical protein C0992_004271 [Termitomyces sp. T32_za158]
MQGLYNQLLLDDARIKLMEMTGINREDLGRSALLAAVKAKLPDSFVLDDAALKMIFTGGPLRQCWNTAVHEGSQDVLDFVIGNGTDLDNVEQESFKAVFKYVYGDDPTVCNDD